MLDMAGTFLTDPSAGLVMAAVLCALTVFILVRTVSRSNKAGNPLSGLFDAARFETEAKATDRRISPRHPRGTVLRGRIDHLAQVGTIWGTDTRDEALAQVARVMRSGLRKRDLIIEAEGPAGDASFIILAQGASEGEANRIAQRLREQIAQTEVAGMGSGLGITASFGVAARREGESVVEWHARAGSALAAAQAAGEDSGLTAKDWEGGTMLPPPEDDAGGQSAQAA